MIASIRRRRVLEGAFWSTAAALSGAAAWAVDAPGQSAFASVEGNKRTLREFGRYLQQRGIDAAFEQYIARDFVSHSQAMPDGRDAFYRFMKSMTGMPPWRGVGPRGSVLVGEKDWVVDLTVMPFASDVVSGACTFYRFSEAGQIKERWGFWQPWREPFATRGYMPNEDLLYKEPAGDRGYEARNTQLAVEFFSGLGSARDLAAHVRRYVSSSFHQHDPIMMPERDGYAQSLAAARSRGATWNIKHTVAERDTVILMTSDSEPLPAIVMLDYNGEKPVATKGPVIKPVNNDPETIRDMGAMGDAGRGEAPLLGSPEQEKPGSAAILTIRFDSEGKIAEHWRLRQPFVSFWAYSGRWNARSVF